MVVFADKDGLYQAADDMRQIAALIKGLNYQIEQLVFFTCEDWQGEAERAFAGQIITVNGQFEKLYAYVDKTVALLKRFADEYESMDTDIANKIKGI